MTTQLVWRQLRGGAEEIDRPMREQDEVHVTVKLKQTTNSVKDSELGVFLVILPSTLKLVDIILTN